MSDIRTFGKYGNAWEQAKRAGMGGDDPHGLSHHHMSGLVQYWDEVVGRREAERVSAVKDRLDSFFPQMTGGMDGMVQDVLHPVLPQGANLGPYAGRSYRDAVARTHERATGRTANALARRSMGMPRDAASFGMPGSGIGFGDNSTFITQQRPYQPEFESPDRQQYPVHRILANRFWRLFWKLDPVIGNCIEMYSQLPWGGFELTGEGVEGEIKDRMEHMVKLTKLRSILPTLVQEYLIVGEVGPHCFYDKDERLWTYIAVHNPDQLEVLHAPFIKMDPIVEFVPDDRLRQVLTSTNPMLKNVRDQMPDELITRLMARQNIPLSPLNFTFIPRKLHPYDTRGTSLLSRMWRILMYEDAIFNASIATARRHAGPIKVAKLGDPNIGYIPPPEQERRLLQLLAQAELDVNAWLVYHYAINFELVGTTDRIMAIDKHWDLIERVKLVAMGISKAFLHGEVTYASAASGLTVFLQRLKAIREFFEAEWLYPKFFKPIAKLNGWVKPTQAELDNRVRIRRSYAELEEDDRLIIPEMKWDKSLDPEVDMEMISAMQAISQGLGVKISKRTAMASVNQDYEDELRQAIEETEIELKLAKEHPEAATLLGLGQPPMAEGAGGGGMPAGGAPPTPLPAVPEESFDAFPPGETMGEIPEGASGGSVNIEGDTEDPDAGGPSGDASQHTRLKSKIWTDGRYGDWNETDVADLVDLFEDGDTDGEVWVRMLEDSQAVRMAVEVGDEEMIWAAVEDWLITEGYPARAIRDLEDILKLERVLSGPTQRQRVAMARELHQVRESTKHLPKERLLTGARSPFRKKK